LVNAAQEGGGALEELVRHVGDVGNLSSLSTIELGRLAEATISAAETAGTLSDAQAANADSNSAAAMTTEELADAYGDLSDAVDEYLNKIQGTEEAAAGEAEAQQALFDALTRNGNTFNTNTAAGRENIAMRNSWFDAVGAQVQAAFDFAAAGGNEEVAARRANNAIRDGVGDLRRARDAGLITADQFRDLAGRMRNIPHNIPMSVGPIANYNGTLNQINNLYAAAVAAGNAVNQIGGSLAGGGTYNPPGGGGGDSATADSFPTEMGWGGAPTVVVQVQGSVVGDVDRFADEVAYRAAEKLSRSGAF
jgi:hypothetical protein